MTYEDGCVEQAANTKPYLLNKRVYGVRARGDNALSIGRQSEAVLHKKVFSGLILNKNYDFNNFL